MTPSYVTTVLLGGLAAVSIGPAERRPTAPQREEAKVSLVFDGGYARATDTVEVTIQVETKDTTRLPAGFWIGRAFDVHIDGKKVVSRTKGKPIEVAKGTRITVSLPMDLSSVLKRARVEPKPGKTVDIEVSMMGTKASIKVVADFEKSQVAVEDLDLAGTKVALVTNFGTIVLGFRPDKAPGHVQNFVKLSRSRFYDGTRFHRVMPGFMIQGGDPNTRDDDPTNDGTGGPGYAIKAELNDLKHEKGVLSMARGSGYDTAGSQFFIMHGRGASLDGEYTAFGKVEQGIEFVDRICTVPLERRGRETSLPKIDVRLIRAVLIGAVKSRRRPR